MAAGEAGFIDNARNSHQLVSGPWAFDEALNQHVEDIGRAGQQDKKGF